MISPPAEEQADVATARRDSVTKLLGDLRDGRREALDELFPLIYQELRGLAHRQRARRKAMARAWLRRDLGDSWVLGRPE